MMDREEGPECTTAFSDDGLGGRMGGNFLDDGSGEGVGVYGGIFLDCGSGGWRGAHGGVFLDFGLGGGRGAYAGFSLMMSVFSLKMEREA